MTTHSSSEIFRSQRALDRRQRDVHDRVVEHDHEQAEGDGARASTTSGAPRRRCWRESSRARLVDTNRGRVAPVADVVWTPSEDVLERANVVRLMRRHGFSSYRELVARSIEDPEWFWPAAVEDIGLELYEPWSRGRRPVARPRVGDLVRRREAEHRLELRPPLAQRPGGGRLPRRGRGAARADLRRALGRGHAARGAAGRARRRAGRPRRDLPADVARGRRSPRTPAPTSARCRCRSSPASRRRRSRSGWSTPARRSAITARSSLRRGRSVPMLEILEEARRRGARARARDRRAVGRRGRRLPRHARAARGRLRASVPPHVHVRNDRETQGRAPRPGRLPGLDRARGLLPGGRAPRRRRPLLHRHGLDHGSLDRGRLRRHGRDPRLRGRGARLAVRPAVAPGARRSA